MRIVSWFSCGAASAVATVFAAMRYEGVQPIYCRVAQEHDDNFRFIKDFENTFHMKVKIITNEQFNGDIYKVFMSRKFIKNQHGAPCTMLLKKELRKQFQQPSDLQVFGYTVEEQARADRFIDANNDVNEYFPLIDNSITKKQTLELISNAGINLPVMYQLGYLNNNCIGCVKGGMGYWNKIRKDFPDAFTKAASLERTLGHSICKGVYLDELSPTRGRFVKDSPGDCGFTCETKL
jgi:3'-phosphoadenosine 5'-phosphosulfate sulfotransferase (PAPS reductase)/FAD synthetase